MCQACNEAIKEAFSPTKQQRHHRVYESSAPQVAFKRKFVDIDPQVTDQKRKSDRRRLVGRGIGALAGTALGLMAGGKYGKSLSGGSDTFTQGKATGLAQVGLGVLGAAAGSRLGSALAGSRAADIDYANAIAAELERDGSY
jgi:hypothetical protein